ncbi:MULTISPECIES: DUF3969 family protein [unclassified Paenibacillus]|uniref:DUF3969 family protein n=1 Tax=unclassified Paenibacillus TaxID=185978 RepID=UPI0030FA0667
MNLNIELNQSEEIQKFLCILNLGMLDSLMEGVLTFEEAHTYLYRPYIAQLLKQNSANQSIIELFEECCMLEDISDIAPEKLTETFQQKKKETLYVLKSLSTTENSMYWINKFDE